MVNIDYGQIFDTGKNSPVPENVPFRFTQNISGALSFLELGGIFMRISLSTLNVLIKYKNIHLTISEDFLEDQVERGIVTRQR